MNLPADEIVHYIDHLEDREWIERLVDSYGVSRILESVSTLIVSGCQDTAHVALTFARDIGTFGISGRDLTSSIRNEMPSLLFPALREGLYAKSYAMRSNVVYTTGKLSFNELVPDLREAFDHYNNSDPLLLPRVVNELFWLLSKPEWAYIEQLRSAAHHMIRWSAIGAIEPYSCEPGDDTFEQKHQTYECLSADSFDLLRAESRYRLAVLAEEALPPAVGKERKALVEPTLTFDMVENRFTNQLADGADYTMQELDDFVQLLRNSQMPQ